MTPTPAHHVVRELLRDRDLKLLLGSQFLAQAADGLAQAVFADVLVLEPLNAGTPGRILMLFAVTLLPYSLISPFLGVLVDRWPRRSLLMWTNHLRGLMLLTLFAWSQLLPGNSALFGATLVLLGFGRLFLTTKGAVLPVLLHEHHLLRGNSLSSGGGMVAALLGAVAGIASVLVMPPEAAFAVAGAIYVAAALTARAISVPLGHGAHVHESIRRAIVSVAGQLVEGMRAIWSRAGARLPLISIFLLRTLAMFVVIAAILIIKDAFGDEAERVGRLSSSALALGAAGIGAFVGAMTAPRVGTRLQRGGLILFGFAISSAGIVALGGVLDIYAVMALTFLGGYGGFVSKVAVDAAVQDALPDEYRGRAFALYDILYNLASVAAGVVMVAFYPDDPSGLRPLMIVAGFVGLALTALMAAAFRRAGIPTSHRPVSDKQGEHLSLEDV